MQYRKFNGTGKEVPIIGQGTWKLVTSGEAGEEAVQALKFGLERGMTHIDTAEMYGDGASEKLVAETIKNFPREQLFLVSKVLPQNASYKGTIAACEQSLSRLGVDYLDAYLLHWRGSHPISETMHAMEDLIDQGKIRALGVSNFDVEDLEEAQQNLKKYKISCNQVLYHLHERGIEKALVPYCQQRSIAVVGYTPFGSSPLSYCATESGAALATVAKKHGATQAQVTLAFLTRIEGTFTIPKASKVDHVRENAEAGDLQLDKEDIELIDKTFPAPKRRTPLAWA